MHESRELLHRTSAEAGDADRYGHELPTEIEVPGFAGDCMTYRFMVKIDSDGEYSFGIV